jgi:exonuclease SbcC
MQGFASYRRHTVVDFTDADYFVLTGPTGSGKSTVIDGIVFALYGTAPRWGGPTVVRYALAPTAQRATVRLVFDVGADRYQIAREVRRSGDSLSQKNVSLERFLDPADPASASPLASDPRGATLAVSELLGISLDEFCKAVVLPQGQFAEFLTASPGVRQDILLKLLGSDKYERVRIAAGERAAAAKERVITFDAQVQELAGATEESVEAARRHIDEIAVLRAEVTDRLTDLAETRELSRAAARELTTRQQRLTMLQQIEVPAGVGDLQERATRIARELDAASQAEDAATLAAEAAREALDAVGDVGRLKQVQSWWQDLGALERALPDIESASTTEADAAMRAEERESECEREWLVAKDDLDAAQRQRDDARTEHELLVQQRGALASIRRPEGIDDLDARLTAASAALRSEADALCRAEDEDVLARRALAEAGSEGELTKRLESLDRWRQLRLDIERAQKRVTSTEAEVGRLGGECTAADERVAGAEAALRSARDQHTAASLRDQLAVGDDCPVCARPVDALPPRLDAGGLHDAQAEQAAATTAQKAAERGLAEARARAESAVSALTELVAQEAGLRAYWEASSVDADEPRLRAEIEGQLRAFTQARTRASAASAALEAARRLRDNVVRSEAELKDEADRARAELRTARDTLIPLGVPSVDDDSPALGWTMLLAWATAHLADIDGIALPSAVEGHTRAESVVRVRAQRLSDCAAERARAQTAAKEAVGRAADARAAHQRAERDLVSLVENLSGEPSRADIESRLAELTRLEAVESTARRERQETREALRQAQARRTEFESDRAAALGAFRTLHAQLAPLGAPPAVEDDLAAAWSGLAAWTAHAAERARDEVRSADEARVEADTHVRAAERAVLTTAQAGGLACSAADDAGGVVAAELGRATTLHEQLQGQLARRLRIETYRQAAERERRVAELLATHLRSDRFPRWLAGAALDVLVASASDSLMELSGGQFSLSHDDKEFSVIDHADAESRRSVRTLSGGETFQASLALALALSGEFSGLSSSGSQLDSIFLDEGFGTLDADSLEVVAATLEHLAQGDRMVGVVTHVSSLAERIPTRFVVSRDAQTSTIVRQEA